MLFLLAIQAYSSWAEGLDVNLIVSNKFKPTSGYWGGSGIFHRGHRTNPDYAYAPDTVDPLLIISEISTLVDESRNRTIVETGDKLFAETGIEKETEDEMLTETTGIEKDTEDEMLTETTGIEKKVGISIAIEKEGGITTQSQAEGIQDDLLDGVTNSDSHFKLKSPHFHYIIWEKLDNYSSIALSRDGIGIAETCSYGGFCCRAEYRYDSKEIQTNDTHVYKLLALNGFAPKGKYLSIFYIVFLSIYLVVLSIYLLILSIYLVVLFIYLSSIHLVVFFSFLMFFFLHLPYNFSKGGGLYKIWTQTCAVLYCTDTKNINSCGNFSTPQKNLKTDLILKSVSATFDMDIVYPSIFKLNFELAPIENWYLASDNDRKIMHMNKAEQNILAATLMGRIFPRDE